MYKRQVHYILHSGEGFLAFPLIGQRPIVPIVGSKFPGSRHTSISLCLLKLGFTYIFGFNCTIPITSDAYFLTRNPIFPGKQPLSAFPKIPPHFLIRGKRRYFKGDKIIIPGWSMYYIKYNNRIRSGLWALIFSHFHSTLPGTKY